MSLVGGTTKYENACWDSGWLERPTSGPIPCDMNGEAYGSRDDGIQRTPVFVTMTLSGQVSQRVMKNFLGFGASLLYSLPWREGVRGRGDRPIPTGTLMFDKRLAVEVDGGQHGEVAFARRDEERTRWSKTRLRRAESGRPAWGQRHTLTLSLSRQGRGDGEQRHERMAHAIPPLGASGFDIRRK